LIWLTPSWPPDHRLLHRPHLAEPAFGAVVGCGAEITPNIVLGVIGCSGEHIGSNAYLTRAVYSPSRAAARNAAAAATVRAPAPVFADTVRIIIWLFSLIVP
jgi:hypothetical protein